MTADRITDEVSILLSGQAGQGIQTIQAMLMHACLKDGYHVFATKEYMSRIRGGVNTTRLRIASYPIRTTVFHTDLFIPLTSEMTDHLQSFLSEDTFIMGDNEHVELNGIVNVPFTRIAEDFGNKLYANSVAVGVLCGILEVQEEALTATVTEHFEHKADDVIQANVEAARKGRSISSEMQERPLVEIERNPTSRANLLLSGGQAVALGATAGNCDFTCSYPMSPSTAVLTAMAEYSRELDIVVEQTEDEIAAINMALGASYAGARPLVTTSGGGFSLMCEGLSLAGIIETPVVIHLAQRPGPATGLPTRTEQGDLELALYGGHGEFPRILLAPGDTREAFFLTQKAFNLADKYQVPVIVLTDQFFVDSYYNIEHIDATACENQRYIVETDESYNRFALTENGISPRGIPGYGSGSVNVDSDEHDETGRITEDLTTLRPRMNHKRAFLKTAELEQDVIEPSLEGPQDYRNLVICWGSTKNAVSEACHKLDRDDTAMLHFPQLYPLPRDIDRLLNTAENTFVVEQNATGQFANLLHKSFCHHTSESILKTDGLPFAVEEIIQELNKRLPGTSAT